MSFRKILLLLILGFTLAATAAVQLDYYSKANNDRLLSAGRNVNMVSGTNLPYGDPWLQRQNEPSIAVSTRNPLHLLAGANDYRTIDMPEELPGEPLPGHVALGEGREPWLGVFKSFDGGQTWITTLVPGFPLDYSPQGSMSPLKFWQAAADPVVRAGTNGMFYYSGIAFNRANKEGVLFVSRFIDNNNLETHTIKRDCIKYIDTKIIATGLSGIFIDKPWIAVDLPQGKGQNVIIEGQSIARHTVYVAFAEFTGSGDTLKSTIRFAQSEDCGETWNVPIGLSTGNEAYQGATIGVDPRGNGHICVAWRRFGKKDQLGNYLSNNSIFIARSVNAGKSFNKVVNVASFDPFDQGSSGGTFRTNSYPALAIDDQGRIYLAWSQRTGGSLGFARIVLSNSINGIQWSKPKPITDPGAKGHQIMPSLTFAAGKLMLAWYDQRRDYSQRFTEYINDISNAPRHTLDVRVAEASPGGNPVFSDSIQVSRYHFVLENGALKQAQYNPVNYPLFKGGEWPFLGDYIDIAPSPMFILDNNSGQWRYNSERSSAAVYHVAWTDNRDVRPPKGGSTWKDYGPPTSTQEPPFSQTNSCAGSNWENAGMRNQNIYTAPITKGIIAGSPWNTKPLGNMGKTPEGKNIPRAFVVIVKNTADVIKSFRLSIANQPPQGRASFLEFLDLFKLDVEIAAYSSVSRSVFVDSTDPKASVRIDVAEIDSPYGNPIPGGLGSYVILNPEIENPEIENPEIENPEIENILLAEYHNPEIENPEIENPEIENPEIENPEIINPEIINPEIENPEIENPEIINPEIENPNITDPSKGQFTDVIWKMTNKGNTTSSYVFKTLSTAAREDGTLPEGIEAQLLIYRIYRTPAESWSKYNSCDLREQQHHELIVNIVNPEIENPEIENPEIENPEIENPEIENATFSLPPEGEALVLLRLWKPYQTPTRSLRSAKIMSMDDITSSLIGYVSGTARNTEDLQDGIPTYPDDSSVFIITSKTLASGRVGQSYSDFLTAAGGTEPYTWSIDSGSLPPGLNLDASGATSGRIHGTPSAAGTYYFIARVTDAAANSRTREVWITIFPSTGAYYTISGRVTVGFTGLGGVTMNVSSGSPATTDSAGYYSISVSSGWSGTVTPTKTGHTFTPPSTSYSNVTSNQVTNYLTGPPIENPPFLWRSPESMSFSAVAGGTNPASQTLQVKNSGDGTLSYTISDDATWLSVTPASGSSTGDPANSHTVDVNISGLANGTYNGTITITASGVANSPQTVAVTLTLTAPPVVQFATTSSSGGEGLSVANLHVSLSAASGQDVKVNYDVTGGTATGGGVDYTLASGVATITSGSTTTNIVIAINDDTLDEPDETVMVTLSNPVNATLGANTVHTYTIQDNDLPTVEFTAASSSGDESVAGIALEVRLSSVSDQDVTVNFGVTGGTASGGGVDYALASGTTTITHGTLTTNISVTIVDDSLDEADETIVVTLSSPVNATLGAKSVHTYTIQDNDAAPVVQFTAASSSGDESTSVNLEVSLSAASGQDVTVNYGVTGGTASGSGVDYALASGTATITHGTLTTNIPVTIVDDSLDEPDETIEVTLSNPVNATLGAKSVHAYTIQDNDAAPVVEFTLASSTSDESLTSVTLEVRLSSASGKDVTVNYAATGGTASGGGVDYTLTPGVATITSGSTTKNIVIAINDDTVDEPDETIEVTLSNPVNATLGAKSVHTYRIQDNDLPTVEFTLASSSGDESVTPVNLDVSLSAASDVDVTVNYGVTGGTASGSGLDYTLAAGTATIIHGSLTTNIPVTIVNDSLDEADETIVVTLSGPVNATLGAKSVHTYTIQDNDAAPVVQFTTTSSSGGEGVTPVNLEVSLSAASGQNVTVTVSYYGSATNNIDYTSSTGTSASIPAGNTTANINISIVDDSMDEDDETIEVRITNPVNATLGTNREHDYTINDNDAPPEVFFVSPPYSHGESGTAQVQFGISGPSGKWVGATLSTSNGTATHTIDYQGQVRGHTWTPGNTDVITVDIPIYADTLDEPDETVILTLTADQNCAVRAPNPTTLTIIDNDYTIEASAGSGGTISPSGSIGVEEGSSKTFTMAPASCYEVSEVKVDGTAQGPPVPTSYTFTNVTSNHTIAVKFAPTGVVITSASPLPDGGVGTAYNQTLTATCYDTGNILVWSVQSGSLPLGLDMGSGGVISGTPTLAGTYSFTILVLEKFWDHSVTVSSDTKIFSLTIHLPPQISGHIDGLSAPVTVVFSGGQGSATTDYMGNYSKTVSYNWSGSAVPDCQSAAYNFSPAYRTYSNVTTNVTGQGYTASARNVYFTVPPVNSPVGVTFMVKVKVTGDDGSPIPGVLVTVAMGANPSGGILSGAVTNLTNEVGDATFYLSINAIGVGYTIIATTAGPKTASSLPFNIN